MKISKMRASLTITCGQPVQFGVQRIREIARVATRSDRVGGAVERGPEFAHEVLPRRLESFGAGTRKREVFQMQRCEITIELPRVRRIVAELTPRALL